MLHDIPPRLPPHLRNLEVIICGNASDRDEETRDVYGRQLVVEDYSSGGNGDDFFEDTADGESDDGGALEERKFGGCHAEC